MNPQDTIQQALLKELGLEGLPVEAQKEAMAAIAGPVLQSVMLEVLEKIPQDQQADFQKALEAGDALRVEALMAAAIPDSTTFVEQSVAKAIAEFKSLLRA